MMTMMMLLMMVITMGVVSVLLMFLFGGEICLNLLCFVKKSSTQTATTPTTAALQVWDTPVSTKALTKVVELVAEVAEALATSITILATTPT